MPTRKLRVVLETRSFRALYSTSVPPWRKLRRPLTFVGVDMNKRTHELVLFRNGVLNGRKIVDDTAGSDPTFHVITTTLRFDPLKWKTFQTIRDMKAQGCFGLISKSAFVLIQVDNIEYVENGDLYVAEDTPAISVWVKDHQSGGWQANACFV